MLYRFVLDNHPLGDNTYTEKVTSISDAVRSQCVQYFYSNGRFIVHVFVQMFSGFLGTKVYSIFLALWMFLTMWLFGRFCLPVSQRQNPLWWLGIAVTFLYLFQDKSGNWYSIAGGMNYLYPMPLMLIFLLLFRRCKFNSRYRKIQLGLLALLGLVIGWSQECYSLPVSGGVFFVLAYNLLKRRRISTVWWVLACSLWIGTIILVFAPGNFVRLSSRTNIFLTLLHGIKLLIGTRLFWLMLLGLLALRISGKERLKNFVQANAIVFFTLAIALCFGMVANTLPQSFNGISFYSAIILFRLSSVFPPFKGKSVGVVITLLLIGFILVLIHQIRIVDGCVKVSRIHHEFVQTYIASPDGVMGEPEIQLPADVRPFVSKWYDSSVPWWLWFTLNQYYFKGTKPLFLLDDIDLQVYREGDKTSLKKIVDGVYQGSSYLWFEPSVSPVEGDSVSIEFYPLPTSRIVSLCTKIFGLKNRIQASEQIIVVDSTTAIGATGSLRGIKVGNREIKNITIYGANK